MEIWKKINGYYNYEVSNYGRIRSKNKILKPQLKGNGYLQISLCVNGKCKTFLLHRLIAETFIPNPDNYKEVNHKDENKCNNNVSNLEWCTRSYNMKYGNQINKHYKAIKKYDLEGYYLCTYKSAREASLIEKINYSGISQCCNKKIKTYKGYIWRFSNDKV